MTTSSGDKVLMRAIIGNSTAYTVISPDQPPRTFVDKPISVVMTELINAYQVIPTAAGPVTCTTPVEILDTKQLEAVQVMSTTTGESVSLGKVIAQSPGCRVARYSISHPVYGWISAEIYNLVSREMGARGLSPTLPPVGTDDVLIGPALDGSQEQRPTPIPAVETGHVKQPVFI